MNLGQFVKAIDCALTIAEEKSGKCLASDNFTIIVPPEWDSITTIMGYTVLNTVIDSESVTLVAKPHVNIDDGFRAAVAIFNEEMRNVK